MLIDIKQQSFMYYNVWHVSIDIKYVMYRNVTFITRNSLMNWAMWNLFNYMWERMLFYTVYLKNLKWYGSSFPSFPKHCCKWIHRKHLICITLFIVLKIINESLSSTLGNSFLLCLYHYKLMVATTGNRWHLKATNNLLIVVYVISTANQQHYENQKIFVQPQQKHKIQYTMCLWRQ